MLRYERDQIRKPKDTLCELRRFISYIRMCEHFVSWFVQCLRFLREKVREVSCRLRRRLYRLFVEQFSAA